MAPQILELEEILFYYTHTYVHTHVYIPDSAQDLLLALCVGITSEVGQVQGKCLILILSGPIAVYKMATDMFVLI